MPRTPVQLGLDRLEACHKDVMDLCDELEAIADSLPGNLDRQGCRDLAGTVCGVLAQAHRMEEELLFPTLDELPATLKTMPSTLERLRCEHYEDIGFAEELHDALLALGRGTSRLSPDAAGYMLRGFFESVRRHVAFERELLTRFFR